MNKGIKLSTGNIIGFINSDDFLSEDNIIQKIVSHFKKHDADIVYGDKRYVDRLDINQTKRIWIAGNFDHSKLKYGWMPPHLSTYIKKEVYKKNGLFRTDMKIAADYEFFIRCIFNQDIKVKYLPEIIAVMREGGVSNKSIKNRLISLKEVYKSWKLNDRKVSPLIMLYKPLTKLLQFIKR